MHLLISRALLQIGCIFTYYQLAKIFGRLSSTFPHTTYGDIPHVPEDPSPWRGVASLRKSLQKQGRLGEAFSLLSIETNFVQSKSEKLERVQEFLEADKSGTRQQSLWIQEGSVRLLLAEIWREIGNSDEAEREICRAETLHLSSLTSIPTEYHGFLDLEIQYARMTLNGDDTSMLGLWVELADKALSNFNHLVGVQSLDKAAELARILLE